MRSHVAIITGGTSSEKVVSLRSAARVMECLQDVPYSLWPVHIDDQGWHAETDGEKIPIDRNDFSFSHGSKRIKPDFAFIIIHGPPGEDGILQACFDSLKIPYSTAGVLSLALSFNKALSKSVIRDHGIPTAPALYLKEDQGVDINKIVNEIGLPCFVKPNRGGSSFGVTRVKTAYELTPAIEAARREDPEVLIETYLEGRELTCAVLRTANQHHVFPVCEIRSKNEFFDYEAKYTPGMADEIVPAPIEEELARRCQDLASRVYDIFECRGLVRIDFIELSGELYFLELNGIPGMSKESIVPKMIRAYQKTEREIYRMIIEDEDPDD